MLKKKGEAFKKQAPEKSKTMKNESFELFEFVLQLDSP